MYSLGRRVALILVPTLNKRLRTSQEMLRVQPGSSGTIKQRTHTRSSNANIQSGV